MKDSNIISFIYSRHDRILYLNLVGNRFKNNISMTKATSNIGTWLLVSFQICGELGFT